MTNIYFVKYSFINDSQHLLRMHNNCNLEIDSSVTEYYEFVNKLAKDEYKQDVKDLVIDFMIKVGEYED